MPVFAGFFLQVDFGYITRAKRFDIVGVSRLILDRRRAFCVDFLNKDPRRIGQLITGERQSDVRFAQCLSRIPAMENDKIRPAILVRDSAWHCPRTKRLSNVTA